MFVPVTVQITEAWKMEDHNNISFWCNRGINDRYLHYMSERCDITVIVSKDESARVLSRKTYVTH